MPKKRICKHSSCAVCADAAECEAKDNKYKKRKKRSVSSVGAEVNRDCLLVVGIDVPLAVLKALRHDEIRRAISWAGAVHFASSDNLGVKIPPKPEWLEPFERLTDYEERNKLRKD